MWFPTFGDPHRHSQPAPEPIEEPNSESTSPALSVESLPNPHTSALSGSPTSKPKRHSSVHEASSPTKRRVKFRPQKVPTKQFAPSCAVLIRDGTTKGSKKKFLGLYNMSEEITKDVLNNNDNLRERIDCLLASGYSREPTFKFAKMDNTYTLTSTSSPAKRNSALTPEPCPSEVAKFSMAFDPYKVVTISFPQALPMSVLGSPPLRSPHSRSSSRSNSASTIPRPQTMLPVSTPSPERSQSFVYEGVTYTWHYNSKRQQDTDEATSPADKSLCSMYLTKTIDSLSSASPRTMTDVVCARFLRMGAWKKKGTQGCVVIDEVKIDARVVLSTLMVCLKRERRNKFAKVVGIRRWR